MITAKELKNILDSEFKNHEKVKIEDCKKLIETVQKIDDLVEKNKEFRKETDYLIGLRDRLELKLNDNENKKLSYYEGRIKVIHNEINELWEDIYKTHMYTYNSVEYCRALEILQDYRRRHN